METENKSTINHYINVASVAKTIMEIYTKCINNYGEEKFVDFLKEWWTKGGLSYLALQVALQMNWDMREYLHKPDQRICGNFNNARWDYERETGRRYEEMVARLDGHKNQELQQADRDWLTAWMWETIGTFGLEYNFQNYLADYCSTIEMEE